MRSSKDTFTVLYTLVRETETEISQTYLKVVGTYSYDPGRYSGPPEDCYPSEEYFNYKILLNDVDWNDTLTNEEEQELEDLIRENLDEPDYGEDCEDDYDPFPDDVPDYWDAD